MPTFSLTFEEYIWIFVGKIWPTKQKYVSLGIWTRDLYNELRPLCQRNCRMPGFDPRTPGVGSDRFANFATTTITVPFKQQCLKSKYWSVRHSICWLSFKGYLIRMQRNYPRLLRRRRDWKEFKIFSTRCYKTFPNLSSWVKYLEKLLTAFQRRRKTTLDFAQANPLRQSQTNSLFGECWKARLCSFC